MTSDGARRFSFALGALLLGFATAGCTSESAPRSAMLRLETPGGLPSPDEGRIERDIGDLSFRELRAGCVAWQLKVDSRVRDPRVVVNADRSSSRLAEFVLGADDPQLSEDVERAIALTGVVSAADLAEAADRSETEVQEYLADRDSFLSDGEPDARFVLIEFVRPVLDGNRDVFLVDLDHPELSVSDGSSLSNSYFEVGFEPAGEWVEIDSRSDCGRLSDL